MHFRAKLTLALDRLERCLQLPSAAATFQLPHCGRRSRPMAANLFFHRNHSRRRGAGESFCGSQRRPWIGAAVDPAHRARRHRGAGRPGGTCRRARHYPGQATRGGPKHRRPARAQAANRLGIAGRNSCLQCAQRTPAFSRASAGSMRRSRWPCIEARARCYGSPCRPAKKDTNGSLTCFRL